MELDRAWAQSQLPLPTDPPLPGPGGKSAALPWRGEAGTLGRTAGAPSIGPEGFLGLPENKERQRSGSGEGKLCPTGSLWNCAAENFNECPVTLMLSECEVYHRNVPSVS